MCASKQTNSTAVHGDTVRRALRRSISNMANHKVNSSNNTTSCEQLNHKMSEVNNHNTTTATCLLSMSNSHSQKISQMMDISTLVYIIQVTHSVTLRRIHQKLQSLQCQCSSQSLLNTHPHHKDGWFINYNANTHILGVSTLLLIKKSRTFPGLSRTPMRNFPGHFWSPRMLKYKEKTFPLLLTLSSLPFPSLRSRTL